MRRRFVSKNQKNVYSCGTVNNKAGAGDETEHDFYVEEVKRSLIFLVAN